MTNEQEVKRLGLPKWAVGLIVLLTAGLVFALGMLGVSIMERRWESQRPIMVAKPVGAWEPDNAVWGKNYPQEYDSYLKTQITDTKTKYGGSIPRDYLDEDPKKVLLFAGSGFSNDYLQARGHYYAVTDVTKTKRIKTPFMAGTCMTCKSPDVPRLMNKMGKEAFYASNFHDLKAEVTHPIGCADCHDPETMQLRITRPALKEAFAAMGRDIEQVSHQEMRSLVCAQCHVEYYFKPEPKNYLTFPWKYGTTVEAMIQYYDEIGFKDHVHPISKVPILKCQHPDYEVYKTGVHAYRDVSCSDCHMPYRTEGGIKYTDHHVQSPLLNISNSCSVCHRWSESEIKARVETIQDKVAGAQREAEESLVKAHFDVAAAMQAGLGDEELKDIRQMIRHGQFRWDYVSANNGMGFHSPQECMRVLGDAINLAQEARVLTARRCSEKGIRFLPSYPAYETRQQAAEIVKTFAGGSVVPLISK